MDASLEQKAQQAPLAGMALWLSAMVLAAANFLVVLDTTIANVSVPNIAGGLAVSSSQGVWVITSYAVAEAVTVPLTGWLAARFGAVRVFVVGMIGFGICSALCGLAPSLGMLVLFRVMQGVCGGPLMPLSQTLLLKIFPERRAATAMTIWSMTTLVAPILGPILGGLLCDNLGWPFVFFINTPIALICGVFAWRMLRARETAILKARIDFVGLGLLVVWVGSLQVMLDLGKDHDWFSSPMIVGLGLTALVGFVAFLIWELTEKEPVIPLRIFLRRGYAASVLTIGLGFAALMGVIVLTPLWLQQNMGYTATWSGYVTAQTGILAVMAAPFAARLSGKIDPRLLVAGGLSWLGLVALFRSQAVTEMTFGQIAPLLLLQGIGLPFFFVPLSTLALSSVDPKDTASAAGLMNFARTVCGAFAVSIVNTVWENGASGNHATLSGVLNGAQATIDRLGQSGMSAAQATGMVDQLVQTQSVMLSTNTVFMGMAALFAVAALAIWIAPKPARLVDASGVH